MLLLQAIHRYFSPKYYFSVLFGIKALEYPCAYKDTKNMHPYLSYLSLIKFSSFVSLLHCNDSFHKVCVNHLVYDNVLITLLSVNVKFEKTENCNSKPSFDHIPTEGHWYSNN